ncbi:hypothetical protein KL918_000074 [Ogataea parapolymorpha]|uniref:Uncharacterized protein n=1 Tax=Ogataea parapolymorpha (strain ATCC 26012 / BCRC 20466 / JCM 22074 / NRRL Y-7560 / DL-1) TaxID=871575 RepID=W1Q9S0_OGAPD|nr:hypothetical protein HPODL_02764 [Ogataea parapolymorpha DL-1]ESW96125.1 hypothetical protein HPODL_02764 [Ogataea parapolymorpha DL-1]KAG7869870.1 hypothetical protein KL918_000074 [Ogataea parapolymorpha]KAG7873158.1 hypothetical protein KL916_002459 [Ogataea parapolymorpha]
MSVYEAAKLANTLGFALMPVATVPTVGSTASLVPIVGTVLDLANCVLSSAWQPDLKMALSLVLRAFLDAYLLFLWIQQSRLKSPISAARPSCLPRQNRFFFTPSSIPANRAETIDHLPLCNNDSNLVISGSYPPKHKPQTAPVLAALLAVSPVPSNASPLNYSLQNSPPIPAGTPALIGMVLVVATKLAECYSTYFCGRKPYQNVGETVAVLVVMTTHWGFGYLFDSVALLAVVQALNIVAVLGLFFVPKRNHGALAKAQYGSLDMSDSQASLYDSFGISSIDKDQTVHTVEQL